MEVSLNLPKLFHCSFWQISVEDKEHVLVRVQYICDTHKEERNTHTENYAYHNF